MMRRFFLVFAAILLSMLPALAAAKEYSNAGIAVGFHSTAAPIGVRVGFGERYAADLGIGFLSRDGFDSNAFDIGLPISVKEVGNLKALLRPGVLFENFDGPAGITHVRTLSAELEGEVFLLSQFSVSAALGVARQTIDQPWSVDNVTTWRSTGGEFTRVGMHLYLFD